MPWFLLLVFEQILSEVIPQTCVWVAMLYRLQLYDLYGMKYCLDYIFSENTVGSPKFRVPGARPSWAKPWVGG